MKKVKYGKTAAIITGAAFLAVAGFTMFTGDASAFGPGRGESGGFGPGITLTAEQREQVEAIHGECAPLEHRQTVGKTLDSLKDNPKAEDIKAAKDKIADNLYEGAKKRWETWQVLTDDQRRTLQERLEEGQGNRREQDQMRHESFVRYMDETCDLDQGQRNKLSSLDKDDFRKGMQREHFTLLGEKLNLTDKQKNDLAALRENERVNFEDRAPGGPGRDYYLIFMNDSKFDEKAARKLAAEHADEMVDGYVARAEIHEKVMKILDPVQQKELEKLGGYGMVGHGHGRGDRNGGGFHRNW
ncbi:MAG: Spy/CpxP family protein refolding chaperone [Synergistota bacterium]|nr:Spy/CpxP family protein refolding chaperone [Synergistota bacterium]